MKTLKLFDYLLLAIIIIQSAILLCAWTSCTTPPITIYQQGEGIGSNKIIVTETKNLQKIETIYEGKAKFGERVIVRRELR